MKFLGFIVLAVVFLKVAEAKKETKKIVIEVPAKGATDLNKGKREAALHPYSYNAPRPAQVVHIQAPSNSLHLGGSFSLGGSKFGGLNAHSYPAPKYPLFTPHSPSSSGPVYSSPVHYSSHGSSSGNSPRYTSISGVYKPSGKFSSTGPQIFGPNHLIQPQKPISQPSAIYGFSSPVPSLPHYSETKGLGSFAAPSTHSAHRSHGSFSIPSGSYGLPSFSGSHGSLNSFSHGGSFGGHGSSSSNEFAGFFNTDDKPSHSYLGSSSSSSFKPSTFLGSSISSPSSSYDVPSFSSHGHSSPSGSYGVPSFSHSPSPFSSHSSSLSGSHGFPSFSSHSSPSFSSHSSPSFSSHGSSLSSHISSPSSSYGAPSHSSHGSLSNTYGTPSVGGHGSSHGSLSLHTQSLPSSHGPLPFALSEADKAKLLSGMPIYITGNQLGGHIAGLDTSSIQSHGSPSLSGSYEIPSAGHAAPSLSFSHLLGSSVIPSSTYGAPSHGAVDFSNSLSHEAPSSSYGAPSSGGSYATHEEPSESYDSGSDGKGFLSGFSSTIAHGSSENHGTPSFSSGHDYSDSSDSKLAFNSISSGKLELPSLKHPQLFSEHGASAPSSSYLPSKPYSPPASSYGVPHDTYGPPKSTFIINADSHDASSDTTYNTIKYSRSLSSDVKAKKATT